MRYYVICPDGDKVYLQFPNNPKTRDKIPQRFSVTCLHGIDFVFLNQQVKAEMGVSPQGGAVLGAFGFLIDPVVGLAGMLFGLVAGKQDEQDVEVFNKS